MLDGQKICEVPFIRIKANAIVRMEPEFYNSDTVNFKNMVKASQIISFSQYGTSKELNEIREGYPVLRLNEFYYSFISQPAKYCSSLDKSSYQNLQLKKDDVLICRTNGNPKLVGKSAIVPKDYNYAFASYLFRVRPKRKFINSASLVAFLNSKYGRKEIEKYSMVGNQANFSPAKFREISIPIFSRILNDNIEYITYSSFQKLEKSNSLYLSAEDILNKELNITNVENSKNYSIKSLSESFVKSKRLDAEYYQDKYDQILDELKSTVTLSEICHIHTKNFTPIGKDLYKYIELADISNSDGEICEPKQYYGKDLPNRARRKIKKGQVLVSSIEGSLSSCALVMLDDVNLLCSNGFYVVDSDTINSETLLVLFKSRYIQLLLKQRCSGTILTSIGENDFDNLPFVKINKKIQSQISQKVQESFKLRKQSKDLLNKAVKAVDIAIEKSEEDAIKWLKENTNEYFTNDKLK